MPWHEVDEETAISVMGSSGTRFVLFYASGNPPWCVDCRDAQQSLEEVFGADDAPPLHIVRVGTREQWNMSDNHWKASEYHVEEIPLLIKLIDGEEVSRLDEQDCKSMQKLRRLL